MISQNIETSGNVFNSDLAYSWWLKEFTTMQMLKLYGSQTCAH